jgi:RND superfamily putative drug exporter
MLKGLAHLCYRRRRRVLAGWLVLLVGLGAVTGAAGGTFSDDFELPGSESQEAFDILDDHGFQDRTGFQGQIVVEAREGVDDPAVREAVEDLSADIERTVPDAQVITPYEEQGARQVSEDRTIAYGEVNLADRSTDEYKDAADEIEALADEVDVPGLRVELGGDIFFPEESGGAEMIGLLAAIVILLVAFGSLLAMGLPILTALFGIGCGVAIVGIVANVVGMPSFTNQAVMMIGIGVGIDYALFIVTRYREALNQGLDPESAVVRAVDTAGRAVLFAGTTVVISLLGLFLIGLNMIRGVATGTVIGVLTTMLASVTLLPAVLGFVGRNIDRLGLPHRKRHHRAPFWQRWSRVVQRRPAIIAATGLVALLALAAPALSMRLGISDAGNRPTSDTTRRAYDLLSEGFGPGFNGTLLIAAELPGGESDFAAMEQLSRDLNEAEGVAFAAPPQANEAGDAAIIPVFPTTSPQDERTGQLVDRLRDEVIPPSVEGSTADVKVGGGTAIVSDFTAFTARRLPVVIAAVLILSFLLLMLVFRSLLVPLKAVLMNLLSIGAAYGVMVAVFQWGWGKDLIGVAKEGPVEAFVPMMLFAIVFGLSMDYEVFLLSRIKEEYDRTGDNATAVADGLAVTARVITAAAAVMVSVFAGFVLGDDRAIKVFGLGLATAVFLDATVVRLLLVPATMELLGDRNWWLPKWLDRRLPRIHVEAPTDDVDAELDELARQETPALR